MFTHHFATQRPVESPDQPDPHQHTAFSETHESSQDRHPSLHGMSTNGEYVIQQADISALIDGLPGQVPGLNRFMSNMAEAPATKQRYGLMYTLLYRL